MLQLEPARTAYDLRFRIAGVPVRVHPLFWFITFILGYNVDARQVLVWIGTSFVSILVHEYGHAFAMQRYGFTPHIVLYAFGGLAIAGNTRPRYEWESASGRDRKREIESIVIALAGPAAGFLLAFLTAVILISSGGTFTWSMPEAGSLIFWGFTLPEGTSSAMYLMIHYLFFINIYWGLVNLLPVLPLDGGQVARGILESFYGNRNGLRLALRLSIAVGVVVGATAYLAARDGYAGTMFIVLAISNYQTLRQWESAW